MLDFGIAKLTLANAGDVHTQTGAMMGTPLYMSPEQIKGAHVDQRTDIYAMGIILYQMLTGALPFEVTTLTDLLIAHTTQAPPPLRTHDPTIPAAIESVVLHALEKDPARRFASVEELVRAFVSASIENTAPVSALASTAYRAERVDRHAARRRLHRGRKLRASSEFRITRCSRSAGSARVVILGLGIVVALHPWSHTSSSASASASGAGAPIAATNAAIVIPLASVESLVRASRQPMKLRRLHPPPPSP